MMAQIIDRYEDLLTSELRAWRLLRASKVKGQYDANLFTDWPQCSRLAEAARPKTLDALLREDPGAMHRSLRE